MSIRPIEAEARRILVDASQVYGVYRDTRDAVREYRGGMKWGLYTKVDRIPAQSGINHS